MYRACASYTSSLPMHVTCYVIDDVTISHRAGVAHGAFENDLEALQGIRELFSYIPLSNKEPAPIRHSYDPW